MLRYHLNLFNDSDIWDEEGHLFADLATAETEAIRSMRDVIAEHVRSGRIIHLDHRIEITDNQGVVLKIITFGQVVQFTR